MEPGLRAQYASELEQLRVQVEVMAVRVEENLERMRVALSSDNALLGPQAAAVDVEIDAMNVSLTERCYVLIARESPVATDLRLIVSVVRVLNELECISDHAVRVCAEAARGVLAPQGSQLHDLLLTMCDEVIERFHVALRAWGAVDLTLAEEVAEGSRLLDALHARLVGELLALEGPDAVPCALHAASIARSLERICDHTKVIGSRLRYLITGDPHHLAAEVRS